MLGEENNGSTGGEQGDDRQGPPSVASLPASGHSRYRWVFLAALDEYAERLLQSSWFFFSGGDRGWRTHAPSNSPTTVVRACLRYADTQHRRGDLYLLRERFGHKGSVPFGRRCVLPSSHALLRCRIGVGAPQPSPWTSMGQPDRRADHRYGRGHAFVGLPDGAKRLRSNPFATRSSDFDCLSAHGPGGARGGAAPLAYQLEADTPLFYPS